MGVIKLLLEEVRSILDLVVDDFSSLVLNRNYLRVDESAIRLKIQSLITLQDLLMQIRIDIHGISLDKSLAGLIITL